LTDPVHHSLPGQDDPLVGPYLMNPGIDSITVMWIRRQGGPCRLALTPEGGPAVVAEFLPVRRVPDTGDHVYEAVLRDLPPDRACDYRLELPGGRRCGSFRTLPGPGRPFTCIYYGDNKGNSAMHRRVASRFERHRPLFAMHSGDMTDHGRYEEYRPLFFEPLREVIDRIPLVVARGNHEGDGWAYRQVFALPAGDTWYSFDCGDAHFVVLDTTGWRHAGEKADVARMLAWCESDLAASRRAWNIVMQHEPGYDLGHRKDDWGHEGFLPLFRRYGVDLVLSGHAHGYQRLRPMAARGVNERRPITHVTSAGAGASIGRRPLDRSEFLAAEARLFNYVVLDVDAGELRGRVFDDGDALIDEFGIGKGGPDGSHAPESLSAALYEEDWGQPGPLQGPHPGRSGDRPPQKPR
jgi:predicted phosphodiesterase